MAEFRLRMEDAVNAIGISGSLNSPSRAAALAEHVLAQLSAVHGARTEIIKLIELAEDLARSFDQKHVPDAIRGILAKLDRADVLVIASPIYKASYTGLLKCFFDLIDPKLLTGKVAILAGSGGSPLHAITLEHQFRPLASFFRMWTVPTTIYALDNDFVRISDGYEIVALDVLSRIATATKEAMLLKRADAVVLA